MKKIIIAILVAFLFVGAAHAEQVLEFELNSIDNTTAANFGSLYNHFACEITNRAGTSDILVSIQGSITMFDSAFANIGSNKTISNATTTATNPSTLQFQESGWAAKRIRLHVVSGADIGNTITGICKPSRN